MQGFFEKRIIPNTIVIFLLLVGVAGSIFFTWKTYIQHKIPKVYNEKKIISTIEDDLEDKNIEDYDIENIDIIVSDDNRSFSFTADALKSTDIYSSEYDLKYSYIVENGKWKLVSNDISQEFTSWNLPETTWSVTVDNSTIYRITFHSMEVASVSEIQIVQALQEGDVVSPEIIDDTATTEDTPLYDENTEGVNPDNDDESAEDTNSDGDDESTEDVNLDGDNESTEGANLDGDTENKKDMQSTSGTVNIVDNQTDDNGALTEDNMHVIENVITERQNVAMVSEDGGITYTLSVQRDDGSTFTFKVAKDSIKLILSENTLPYFLQKEIIVVEAETSDVVSGISEVDNGESDPNDGEKNTDDGTSEEEGEESNTDGTT